MKKLIALLLVLSTMYPASAGQVLFGLVNKTAASSLACSYSPITTGTQGTAYTGATPSASGGAPSYTFSETGSLPTGLSISSSTGIISGTPSVNGTFTGIQVKVTDSTSTVANCGSAFTLLISPSGGGTNWTPVATANQPPIQASPNNPVTFPTTGSIPLGTAPASNRYVAACVGIPDNGPPNSVIIGGVTATKEADGSAAGNGVSLWIANVPTGTTTTVVVNNTIAFPNFMGVVVGTFTTNTPTPNSGPSTQAGGLFNPDPQLGSASLTILTNGVGIVCASSTNAVVATPTFNTGTLDAQTVSGTSYQMLLGHLSATGTPSISGYSFQDFSIAASAWGP